MKKIVIVEDKPWVTKRAVKDLLARGDVEIARIVYYPNSLGDNEEKKLLLSDFERETGVQIDTVHDQVTFVKKMEELYILDNVVFFMDYELKGDTTLDADSRINIRYAKNKEYGGNTNPQERKIWFYTVSGVANVEIIRHYFPERTLPVDSYKNGLLVWNQNVLNKILE